MLDFANRDMADVEFLKDAAGGQGGGQVGVLDVRTMMIETPEQIAARIRKVLEHRAGRARHLTTDCGMKPLPRMVAKMKLKALAEGAQIVRDEL